MASNKKAISLADTSTVSFTVDSIVFHPSSFTWGKSKNKSIENGLGANYILDGSKDQPFSFEHIFGVDEYDKLLSLLKLEKQFNIRRTITVDGTNKVLLLKDCIISNINATEDASSTGRVTVDGIIGEIMTA